MASTIFPPNSTASESYELSPEWALQTAQELIEDRERDHTLITAIVDYLEGNEAAYMAARLAELLMDRLGGNRGLRVLHTFVSKQVEVAHA